MFRILVGAIAATTCTQVFAQSTATRIEEGTLAEVVVESRAPAGQRA